jgi:hypothetical protein
MCLMQYYSTSFATKKWSHTYNVAFYQSSADVFFLNIEREADVYCQFNELLSSCSIVHHVKYGAH